MNEKLKKVLKNVKLVIFDLDGTLIDSNGTGNELDIEISKMLGETKGNDEIIRERDNFFSKIEYKGDIYLEYCDYLKKKYNSHLTKEEILNIRREKSKELAKKIQFKPYADVVIKDLKDKKIKLALATVSRRATLSIYTNENVNMKSKCNLNEYFDYIITKDDVKNKKPDPEVYNKIINYFNIERDKAIVIEDSLTGIKAAKAANITTIAIYDKFSDNDREKINELSDYQVQNFKQLMELFN